MIAFFFVSGNGSTRGEVSRVSFPGSFPSEIHKEKKEKKSYDWSRNVVWGKILNNKNNFLLRDHKARNKMIQRLAKRERERQGEKEKERKELRVDMERIWTYTYLSF